MGFDVFGDNPYKEQMKIENKIVEPTNNLDRNKSVKLYFISPYKRDSAIIRPYVWNNTNEIFDDINSLMEDRKREYQSTMGGFIRSGFFLDRSKASHSAMMPSANWQAYKSPILENHGWKFILVVNNEDYKHKSFYKNTKRNRIIYLGFCIGDAPVINRYGRNIIDENARFFITHRTVVEINENINRVGQNALATVSQDIDIISPSLLEINEGDNDRDFILDPGEILSSSMIAVDNDGSAIETINSSSLVSVGTRNNIPFVEESIMNSPKHQVNKVMSGLFMTINENNNGLSSLNGMIDAVSDVHTDMQVFANYLKGNSNSNINSLNIQEPYLLFRDLINRYPNIVNNIDIIELEGGVDSASYGYADIEKAPNLSNMLSSLIKSSVPPIMADCGISEFQIRWASSPNNNYNVFKLNKEPEIKLGEYRTIIPEDREMAKMRVHEAIKQLERYVFSTIIEIAGEFEVVIVYSANKRTVVQLQLRDLTDEINKGYIVGQNDLGGVISPMIGTYEDYDSHLNTLQSFLCLSNNFRESPSDFNIASENIFTK